MGNFYTLRKAYEHMIMEADEDELDAADDAADASVDDGSAETDATDQNEPLEDMEGGNPQTPEEMNAELELKLSDNIQKELVSTMNALSHIVAKICKEKQATKDTVDIMEANLDSIKNLIDTAKNEVKKAK